MASGKGDIELAGRVQAVWRRHRRGRRQSQDSGRRLLLLPRAFGLRQDHHPAHDRGPRRSHRRRDPDRRRKRGRPAAGRAAHRDDVPVVRAVSAFDRARQRGVCPARARHRQSAALSDHRRDAGEGAPDRARRPAARASSRAASSSAWRWRAPPSPSRACCCSTSRCPRSTSSCASRCAPSCGACSASSASPSSTSRIPSSRRSHWPMSWW